MNVIGGTHLGVESYGCPRLPHESRFRRLDLSLSRSEQSHRVLAYGQNPSLQLCNAHRQYPRIVSRQIEFENRTLHGLAAEWDFADRWV